MNRLWLICSRLKKMARPGFLLLELQVSVFLTIMLLSVLACSINLGWRSWQTISLGYELRDSSRYIINRIEKDIGLGASMVKVKKTNAAAGPVIEINTLDAKHVIRIYCDKNRLYRKIITRAGSGVNPLYINDVHVEHWNVEVIDSKRILISYYLRIGSQRKYFQQLIICYNGVAQYYE